MSPCLVLAGLSWASASFNWKSPDWYIYHIKNLDAHGKAMGAQRSFKMQNVFKWMKMF